MRTRPLYDIAAALARLGVGVIFMAHGWQKIEVGITATGQSFGALGVPLPTAAAVYSAFVELLGGAALIAGLGLPVAGALLFIDMAGAFIFVHATEGLFLVDGGTARNGYELVVALGMASLLFAAGAGGRLTVDHWLTGKRFRRPTEDEEDDGTSFIESLRKAEPKPPKKPRSPRRAKPPAQPDPAEPPAEPIDTAKPAAAPKPAETSKNTGASKNAGTSKNTEDDKLVAGRRKPAQRRRASTTQPMKPTPGDGGAPPA